MWLRLAVQFLVPGIILGCARGEFPVCGTTSLQELEGLFEAVVASDSATLVLEVDGSEAFLQFSAGPDKVWMDFPLVTPAQRAREEAIREFYRSRGWTVLENRGSDGSLFLDVVLPPDAAAVAREAREVFQELLGVDDGASITVKGEGFEWRGGRPK